MSDKTPRTDDSAFPGEWEDSVVDADFARILERENMDLRENYNRVLMQQREDFEHTKEARRQFREGTWHGNTTKDYEESVCIDPEEETAFFSLAYQWQDKKHRHVHDLCDWINALQDEAKDFRELVKLLTIQEMSDSGRLFYPTNVSSCRCMDLERIGQITEKYRPIPHIGTFNYDEDE